MPNRWSLSLVFVWPFFLTLFRWSVLCHRAVTLGQHCTDSFRWTDSDPFDPLVRLGCMSPPRIFLFLTLLLHFTSPLRVYRGEHQLLSLHSNASAVGGDLSRPCLAEGRSTFSGKTSTGLIPATLVFCLLFTLRSRFFLFFYLPSEKRSTLRLDLPEKKNVEWRRRGIGIVLFSVEI